MLEESALGGAKSRLLAMRAEINGSGTRLELEFQSFRELVTELGPNISEEGMFVEIPTPAKRDSQLEFSVKLQDDYQLIRGRARVVWIRAAGTPADPPPGMALQFLDLTLSSPDLLERLVETHQSEGGETFDLAREPRPESPAGTVPKKSQTAGDADARRPRQMPVGPSSVRPDEAAMTQAIPSPEPLQGQSGAISAPRRGAPPAPPGPSRADSTRELTRSKVGRAGRAVSREPLPGATEAPPKPDRPSRRGPPRLSVTPSLIILLVGSGIVGGLTYRLTESLVFLMTDVRGGTEPKDFGDIPPPASLQVEKTAAPTTDPSLPPPQTPTGAGAVYVGSPDDRVASVEEPTAGAAPTGEAGPLDSGPHSRPAGPPFTRIRFINWTLLPRGLGTEIVLTANGAIPADRFEHVPLTQREAVKLYGVDWPYPKRMIEVGTSEVIRIRTGFHSRPSGKELHVVLDLQSSAVSLQEIRVDGSRLVMRVAAEDAGGP